MSSEEVELVRLKRRGDRVLEVRNSLAMSGDEFATAINKRGLAHGYEAGYDKSKVSRLEKGKTSFFLAEDAAIIAALDPEERGIEWLVFGRNRAAKAVDPALVQPAPRSSGKTARRASGSK